MSPRLRKVALAAHVTTSVGWLGAVVAFLALAVAGVVSQDASAVSAAYLAMDVTGWFVLVPLALSSLLTGLLQSLGTNWGLFRHYWVVIKLAITVLATVVLLLYMQTLGTLADAARESATGNSDIEDVRSASPLVHAGAALVLLVTATVLAVFKPVGMTAYARRRRIRPEP